MKLSIPKNIWRNLTVLLVTVVLLLVFLTGISAGKSQAQNQLILHNTQELAKGLKYFYNDNNRYPSVLEYQNRVLMLDYFNYFPPYDFVSSQCDESFVYKRISGEEYQLNFCLTKAASGYQSGWNQVMSQ